MNTATHWQTGVNNGVRYTPILRQSMHYVLFKTETSPVNTNSEVYTVMVHVINMYIIRYPGVPVNLCKYIGAILLKTNS